jgi:hypothetical protein
MLTGALFSGSEILETKNVTRIFTKCCLTLDFKQAIDDSSVHRISFSVVGKVFFVCFLFF